MLLSICHGQSGMVGLKEDADKAEFDNRTGSEDRLRTTNLLDPSFCAIAKYMFKHAQSEQGIHIQKVNHGKSARSSRTRSLVRRGALGPNEQ